MYETSYALPVTGGFGLKWYEYMTGVPNVSECFPGNSEYLGNVQSSMAEIQSWAQAIVDTFQTAGYAQRWLSRSDVQAALSWCGQRNALPFARPISQPGNPYYVTMEQAAAVLRQEEGTFLASQGQASMPTPTAPPATFNPSFISPMFSPQPTAQRSEDFFPTAVTTQYLAPGGTAAPAGAKISAGLPGFTETAAPTNTWEQVKAAAANIPTWAWAVGGVALLLPILLPKRR